MTGHRFTKRVRSKLSVRFGQEDLSNIGFTEDISELGIFLKTARTFPVSSEIKIELTTDDDHTVRFVGEVKYAKQVPPNLVWSDDNAGMGIFIRQFVEGHEYFEQLLSRTTH